MRGSIPAISRMRRAHFHQANEGCDFDFLETAFGEPIGEPEIY